jgi:L-malate glycosyltransferase
MLEMAKNALKILKDANTLNEFKAKALATAKQFDIQNILPLYEELYIRAMSIYA